MLFLADMKLELHGWSLNARGALPNLGRVSGADSVPACQLCQGIADWQQKLVQHAAAQGPAAKVSAVGQEKSACQS